MGKVKYRGAAGHARRPCRRHLAPDVVGAVLLCLLLPSLVLVTSLHFSSLTVRIHTPPTCYFVALSLTTIRLPASLSGDTQALTVPRSTRHVRPPALPPSLLISLLTSTLRTRRSEPYDPYVPRGGAGGSSGNPQGGNNKTAAIQQQIDDTVGIMRENITKVAERGERLDSLQDKTGESFGFDRGRGWLAGGPYRSGRSARFVPLETWRDGRMGVDGMGWDGRRRTGAEIGDR
jgi:hypothetical protein